MPWFRRATPADSLALTMTGVKLGDRVIIAGLGDTKLIAALAAKAGLTGHAVVIDPDDARLRAAGQAIEREGGLVELTQTPMSSSWPFDDERFDVAVFHDVLPALTADGQVTARGWLREAFRTLRGGGRVIAIDSAPRGFGAIVGRQPAGRAYAAGGGAVAALKAAGFAAVRVLAEQDGMTFTEAAKRSGASNS